MEMILQKLWEKYCYVILLILISFILGIVNLHILSADSSPNEPEQLESQRQYVVEWTSSENN
jgi:hypothetical protein